MIAEFVAAMEDVLDLYGEPHDPKRPVVCFDETSNAPSSVTEAIINQALPGLPSEDQRRLSRFSRGFPKIATSLSLIWPKSEPIVNATDDDLVDTFVQGRRPRNPELLLQSAELLSVFDLVGVESSDQEHFAEITSLGHGLEADGFRGAVKDLADRGVVQRRGRLGRLQPLPIALRLAERQWRRWTPELWDQVLAGSVCTDLNIAAAQQLRLLNDTSCAGEVVKHVCRYGGPFDVADGSYDADQLRGVLAHEVSHYWWNSKENWIDEGMAEFLRVSQGRRISLGDSAAAAFGVTLQGPELEAQR